MTNSASQDEYHIARKYQKVLMSNSLKGADSQSKELVLSNYYKFIMYRNPAERLLSGYRSKVESYPLTVHSTEQFNWLRLEIYNFTHPEQCKKWLSSGSTETVIWISFSDFIDHWLYLVRSREHVDDHFDTIFSICKPCQVRYNYYGNFKYFNHDAEVLLRHQGANLSFLRQSYYEESGKTTREIAPDYYKQLSDLQKKYVLDTLAFDLRFYYNLFPEEVGSHKSIMDTEHDVPEPF